MPHNHKRATHGKAAAEDTGEAWKDAFRQMDQRLNDFADSIQQLRGRVEDIGSRTSELTHRVCFILSDLGGAESIAALNSRLDGLDAESSKKYLLVDEIAGRLERLETLILHIPDICELDKAIQGLLIAKDNIEGKELRFDCFDQSANHPKTPPKSHTKEPELELSPNAFLNVVIDEEAGASSITYAGHDPATLREGVAMQLEDLRSRDTQLVQEHTICNPLVGFTNTQTRSPTSRKTLS